MNMNMQFRSWAYAHGVRWHAQNLGEDERPRLPMWRYGRAWINICRPGPEDKWKGDLLEINPEWHVKPEARAGIGVDIGGDSNHEIMLSIDLGLARFYLTFDSPYFKVFERFLPGHWFDLSQLAEPYRKPERHWLVDPVEVSVKWFSGGLWWTFWMHPLEWNSREPKWRRGHFDPIDWLLGRHQYSTQDLSTEQVSVPMPEKTYSAAVRMFESTWKRPRWPFAERLIRAEIEVEGGIPRPGKGENAWDCDDDATYSLTTPARNAEEAVGKMVASVLESRRRYGGRNWQPRESVT